MNIQNNPLFCFICGSKLEYINANYKQCQNNKCSEVFLFFLDQQGNKNLKHIKTI